MSRAGKAPPALALEPTQDTLSTPRTWESLSPHSPSSGKVPPDKLPRGNFRYGGKPPFGARLGKASDSLSTPRTWGNLSPIPPHPGKYPRMMPQFPLFRVSTTDKPKLRALNEKAPRKGDLRKACEIPRGFRGIHAVFTRYSRPPLPIPCFLNR